MSVYFFTEDDVLLPDIQYKYVKDIIRKVLASLGLKSGPINYIFCTDDYLLQMNNKFLQHDYFTDVITFDYSERNVIAGDIFISLESVESNAKKFGDVFVNELIRVISHGFWHLLKFNDKEADEIILMRQKEFEFISSYNLMVGKV